MFKLLSLSLLSVVVLIASMFGATAFAQVGPEPTIADWMALFQSMGGLQGAGAMAIAAFVVQALMYAARSKLGEYAGKWRLVAVYALTMLSGALSMKMAGATWGAALMHSNTLAAMQVFVHQVYTQFSEKPAVNTVAPASVVEAASDSNKPAA